jgi:hypothetical protein
MERSRALSSVRYRHVGFGSAMPTSVSSQHGSEGPHPSSWREHIVTVRNVALTGLLAVGITAAGCTGSAPQPAADSTATSPPAAGSDTQAQPQPPANANPAPAPAPTPVAAPAPARTSRPAQSEAPPAQQTAPVAENPPPTVVENNAYPAPQQQIVVESAPPPLQVERFSPRRGYAWTPGYWRWNPNQRRYAWNAGTYVPERPGSVWVPARWERGPDNRWHFSDGHWAQRGGGPGSVPGGNDHQGTPPPREPGMGGGDEGGPHVQGAPPAPRIEPVVARPGMVWTPGYWRWDGGRYDWVGGNYVPARPGWTWAPYRWVQGPRGGWHLQQGHWQRR